MNLTVFPHPLAYQLFRGPHQPRALSSGALLPLTVGKFHPSVIAPSFAKKLDFALFGKRPAAYKIIDFDPLRFSFILLPTTFSWFRAFGAKTRENNLFSSIHNPTPQIAVQNPMPSVGVGLGGLAFSLLLSSVFAFS